MTTHAVLETLRRRWYLAAAGALLLGVVLILEFRVPGVYWTRYEVQLAAPPHVNANSLSYSQVDLSSAASLLAVDFNGHKGVEGPVSPDLTIVDEGVRSGYAVRTPDYGGQWSRSFRPAVSVQIVDSAPETVLRRARRITARLERLLAQRQADLGIPRTDRITIVQVPWQPVISYRAGSRVRTAAATLLAGSASIVTMVVLLDRRMSRSRRAATAAAAPDRALAPAPAQEKV